MKSNRIIGFILIIFIFIISCNMTFAMDLEENNLTQSEILDENHISIDANSESNLETSITNNKTEDDVLSGGNVITVEPDKSNPNEIINPTIQPAIDSAKPGDTIILKGDFFHCHFIVNKTINIISDNATLGPCPHYQNGDSGSYGVFYITEDGSGSVFKGITFKNTARAVTPFSFFIRGASNIKIEDCIADYPESDDYKFQSIVIENSDKIDLSNLVINNAIDGIKITNSSDINVKGCKILNSENQAILINGTSKNINIINNSIVNNGKYGINLACADNIVINNNIIKNNGLSNDDSGSGIYVNTNIVKLIVKGNIFLNNAYHAIMYDYRTRNLNNDEGADQLTVIDDNYFQGHSSMVLHHRIYVERAGGNMEYDAENDIFYKSSFGNYFEGKSYVYMQNAFIYEDVPCGFTYYTTTIPWTLSAPANNGKYDFSLKLSEIKELKSGVYQISIVDSKGQAANDFNSGYFTFFLNDYDMGESQQGNIYKIALIKNGIATADFRDIYESFKTSSNKVTAVFSGLSNSPYMQYIVDDSNIPNYSDYLSYLDDSKDNPSKENIIKTVTILRASALTTYPLSDNYIAVTLVDVNKKPISGQTISFKFNNKIYKVKTDKNGVAKVKVSLTSKKTYPVKINYLGNDNYVSSQATSKIIVKAGLKKSKIKSSNIKIKKNKKKTFKFKLTSKSGKALTNQKVVVKVNGKQHIVITNKKGIGKISIKFNKVKRYKIKMQFLGNSKFKQVSKTNTITVTRK